ncbi:MAG TPA: NADPH-dependent FMN reductase [Gemmatimonadales bacterium]|jgi:chromate reductase|nr:NADPH-dependent FMN reductase [Gemmatimonadales bacterium]
MTTPLELVALSGSLRARSYNTALLRALPELAGDRFTLTLLSIHEFPVFNHDLELDGMPPAVTRVHRAIRESDGLIIGTPEYNHGVPGGLKNAIDWLSRGPMPHGFFGIPTAIVGASDGAFGTTRAQYALRQTLTALNAPTLPAPQVLITHVDQKMDAEGRLTDATTRGVLTHWLAEVERWMRRFPKSERS